VHALGVHDRGEGLLFIGCSGAGKTTLANLYKSNRCHREVTILSDERVIVTKEDDQFYLSGTPWAGGAFTVSAETVPLRKVFFLERGRQNELISDSLINLHTRLFQQLFLPFWHRQGLEFAMQFAHELLSAIPAARLGFVNDTQVIEFLSAQA
jgi:GTPase SAR1 family protein